MITVGIISHNFARLSHQDQNLTKLLVTFYPRPNLLVENKSHHRLIESLNNVGIQKLQTELPQCRSVGLSVSASAAPIDEGNNTDRCVVSRPEGWNRISLLRTSDRVPAKMRPVYPLVAFEYVVEVWHVLGLYFMFIFWRYVLVRKDVKKYKNK